MEKVLCSSGENWKSAFTTYFFAFPRLTQLPTPPLIALRAGIMFLCWVAAEVFSSQAYLLREGKVFEIFYFCCNFLRLYSCSVKLLTNCSLAPRGFSTTSKNTTFSLFSIFNWLQKQLSFFCPAAQPRMCILIFRWASILCMCQIPLVGGDVLCWYWRVKHTQQSVNLKI